MAAHHHHHPQSMEQEIITADSDDTDYETYFTEGGITSTAASLASQVTDYKYENGRRYHAYHEGSYWAPNDQAQSDQLELFDHVYSMRLGGELYLAPIGDNPRKILDLGTGTGSWCINMADTFKDATVIGNDLSPIQPNYVPPNVQFEIDDFDEDWVYHSNDFDYVHARAVYGSVSNWPKFLKEALRVLRPGGWFESVETTVLFESDDGTMPRNSALETWTDNCKLAANRSGKTFEVAGLVKGWCEDAGFTEVEQFVYKIPLGPWPKAKNEKLLGNYNLVMMLAACEGFSLALFTRYLGWDVERVQELLENVKKEMTNRQYHLYYRLIVCIARKPGQPRDRSASPASTLRTLRPSIDLEDSNDKGKQVDD